MYLYNWMVGKRRREMMRIVWNYVDNGVVGSWADPKVLMSKDDMADKRTCARTWGLFSLLEKTGVCTGLESAV